MSELVLLWAALSRGGTHTLSGWRPMAPEPVLRRLVDVCTPPPRLWPLLGSSAQESTFQMTHRKLQQ